MVAGVEVEGVYFGEASEGGEMIRGSISLTGGQEMTLCENASANGLLNIYLTGLNPRVSLLSQIVEGRSS